MSTHIMDLKNAAVIGTSLAPQARTATANGSGVDLQAGGGGSSFAILDVGTATDGTHAIKLQESKNDNTADPEAADAYADITGATFTEPAANTPQVINFKRSKRWVRAVSTIATATTGKVYGVLIGSPKKIE